MWRTNTLRTLANEDLGTLAEYDPLTTWLIETLVDSRASRIC